MDPSSRIDSPSVAVAAILDLLAAPRPWDLPATSRQLRKLLKALQHSLQQNRISASSDSRLVPCLQSLLHFGWDAEEHEEQLVHNSAPSTTSSPIKNNKYVPPGARQHHQLNLLNAPSSDSEGASDAENSTMLGSDIKLSRVRFLALACLQVLIKSDPKAMHPLWPSLLPEIDTDLSSQSAVLANKSGTGSTTINHPLTLAHSLLLDLSSRVRHSAAVTLGTLLEGPAQRAYLAVAELANSATSPQQQQKQALRGFVPLSATLGSIVVGTHETLLRALTSEQDSTVVIAILRALCTALVGTPYSRLSSTLLPNCVDSIRQVLQKTQQIQQHDLHLHATSFTSASNLHASAVPTLVGSLACLAAALGVKPPLPSLSQYLSNENGITLAQEIFACIIQYSTFPAVQLEALMALRGLTQQYHAAVCHLWPEILDFASTSVQTGASQSSSDSTSSTALEGGSSPREKVIQQSVLLIGDYLRHSSSSSGSLSGITTNVGNEKEFIGESNIKQKWINAVEVCIYPVITQYTSPLLQAAGFGAVATGFSSGVSTNKQPIETDGLRETSHSLLLSREMRADLLAKCSTVLLSTIDGGGAAAAAAAAVASPVRAAAAKAMASLISAVPLSENPSALLDALPSLLAACQDAVVAVRVQAATALVAAAEALYFLFNSIEKEKYYESNIELLSTNALSALFPVAVAAAVDVDKIKPSGVQALGALLSCRVLVSTSRKTSEIQHFLISDVEKDAFIACISSENAKVQWSAGAAAGTLLKTLKESSIQNNSEFMTSGVHELVEALRQVAVESNNSRSRSFALAALEHTADCETVLI